MFAQAMNIRSAYRTAGLEAEILGSSPHRLIKLLFDGAFAYIGKARQHMMAGNVQDKAEAITRAVDLISRGLRASLNLNEGGELAQSLDDLYEYIGLQLVKAHLQNDPALLDEAEKLLWQIADAWDKIGKEVDPS
ncbi:MAG: flagellar export chaperone FliS [Rhodocyclales bacterium]|nr:flagellar export chaperone FliS [Rhodocyclales bacterium]